MGKAEAYARQAAEFEREATRTDPAYREQYLSLARAWRDLAASASAAETLSEQRRGAGPDAGHEHH